MKSNFYVGIICHLKKIKKYSYHEKVVLYSEDNINFINLINFELYPIEGSSTKIHEDYVIKDSLIPTDIRDYNINYIYLLDKYKSVKNTQEKKYTKKHKIDYLSKRYKINK